MPEEDRVSDPNALITKACDACVLSACYASLALQTLFCALRDALISEAASAGTQLSFSQPIAGYRLLLPAIAMI